MTNSIPPKDDISEVLKRSGTTLSRADATHAAEEAAKAQEAARAAEKASEKAARILKGDEKNNIKNLYGLTGVFAAISKPLGQASDAIGLTRLFNKGAAAWEEYGGPVRTAFNVVAFVPVKIAQGWWAIEKAGFNKFAYDHAEDGTRKISNTKGAGFILASLAATAMAVAAVPPTADFLYDAGMYAATAKTETMWMTGTDLVDAETNTYTAGACHQLPCNESNSVFYKIRPSFFLEVKSLIDSKGSNYWQPETQIAAIPEVTSKCSVTSAGIRIKPLKWYPYIVDTECSHRMESAMPLDSSSPPPALILPSAHP